MADEALAMAKIAERAERYEDMIVEMKKVAVERAGEGLSTEERNLLSVAYKNVVSKIRSSLRSLQQVAEDPQSSDKAALQSYMGRVEEDLNKYCMDLITLLDEHLIHDSLTAVASVFFSKMKADYYRYLAEFTNTAGNVASSAEAYERAYAKAQSDMSATHPIRLGVALNYSVFLFEQQKKPKEAIDMARAAFDGAIEELDALEEDDYKDATLIMELLRDNCTLWTSPGEDDDIDVEELKD